MSSTSQQGSAPRDYKPTVPAPTFEDPARPRATQDDWPSVERTYRRCEKLGAYFDIGHRPEISDAEVIVCFADLRGFTTYCKKLQEKSLDSRIRNFLSAYFSIYALAVLKARWKLEPQDGREKYAARDAHVRRIIIPRTYKNLGDGAMLVWEIPQGTSAIIQGLVTHYVLITVAYIFQFFEEQFRTPGIVEIDAYSELVKDLHIGFGLTRGHAWKLEFGPHTMPDYAGSVVNLAARLQDLARPEGVVCQREFSQSLLDDAVNKGLARREDAGELRSLGTDELVFIDRTMLMSES